MNRYVICHELHLKEPQIWTMRLWNPVRDKRTKGWTIHKLGINDSTQLFDVIQFAYVKFRHCYCNITCAYITSHLCRFNTNYIILEMLKISKFILSPKDQNVWKKILDFERSYDCSNEYFKINYFLTRMCWMGQGNTMILLASLLLCGTRE